MSQVDAAFELLSVLRAAMTVFLALFALKCVFWDRDVAGGAFLAVAAALVDPR